VGNTRNTCILTTQYTDGLHMMLTVGYDYVAKYY